MDSLAGVAAAFLAVGAQLLALAREHRLVRRRARYDELERAYVSAGNAAGVLIDRVREWAFSFGSINGRQLARDLGEARQAVGVLKMHQASEEAKAKLLDLAESYAVLGERVKGMMPKPELGPELTRLETMIIEYYSLAGEHLREVWPRRKKLD
jgi:hypothetical protein